MTDGRQAIPLVIVGSIGLDTIQTREARREELLGGSVSYACAAASLFTPVGMVGVVGDDFPAAYAALYERRGIDLAGLCRAAGRTFRWSGVYDDDMINRTTLSTELNVFADFRPDLPDDYRRARCILLGNISPELQSHVLDQAIGPTWVVADTMDLWIRTARDALLAVIRRVDVLTVNDAEARLLTGCYNLRDAADVMLDWGPRYVIVKKGEHGAMLVSRDAVFLLPAYPIRRVVDPTGAGDAFAGAMIGHLARDGRFDEAGMRRALLHGAVVASYAVEAFSLDGLVGLESAAIASRLAELTAMLTLDA